MIAGPLLEWAALALALAGLALQGLHLARGDAKTAAWARWLALGAAAAAVAALAVLMGLFLLGRLGTEYVFLYSRTDYPWYYRLVGTWGAQKGTILLWTALLGAAVAWAFWPRRIPDEMRRVAAWTAFYTLLFFIAFLAFVVRQDTFAATPERLLAGRPLGNGLNPILLSPYIVFHPPAEFLGYAVAALPAAGALAFLTTGDKAWARWVRGPTRLAWLLFTVGIVLGALWAYTSLGFGGYWAWDPVEVANLIPWLFLTAFVHARLQVERHGTHRVLAALLALATLWFTLFQTVATRSGLWVSVHAFTDPTGTFAKDPFLRLVNILAVEPRLADLVGLMGAFLFAAAAIAAHRIGQGRLLRVAYPVAALAAAGAFLATPVTAVALTWEGAAALGFGRVPLGLLVLGALVAAPIVAVLVRRADGSADPLSPFTPKGLLTWGVVALLAATLITVAFELRGVNGMNRAIFDDWAPVVALPVILLFIPAFGHGLVPRRTQAWAAGAALVAGLLGALLWDPWEIGLTAPALAVALALGAWRLGAAAAPRAAPPARRIVAAALLIAGVAGLVYWSNPPHAGLGPLSLPSGPVAMAVGLAASTATLIAGPWAGHGRNRTAAVLGSLLCVPAVGFGAAWLLGAAAFAFAWRSPAAFAAPNGLLRNLGAWARPVGVHLLHIGVVVGLAGYAASTYAAEAPSDALALGVGEQAMLGDLELRNLGAVLSSDGEHAFVTQVTTVVAAYRDGREVGRADVGFHWLDQVQHYDPETAVVRLAGRDLYVASQAFCRDETGRCASDEAWIQAHENGVRQVQEGDAIAGVVFQAKVLPLMALLWGAFPLMALGVGLLAVSRRGTAAPEQVPDAGQVERLLDRELQHLVATASAPAPSVPLPSAPAPLATPPDSTVPAVPLPSAVSPSPVVPAFAAPAANAPLTDEVLP